MKNKTLSKIKLFFFTIFISYELSSCYKGNNPSPNGPGHDTTLTWTKLTSSPSEKIVVLDTAANRMYAAAASGNVYVSGDNGNTWTKYVIGTGIEVTAFTIFNGVMYAGTYNNGIFSSNNGGASWTNQSTEILYVSSFVVFNGNLFSSSQIATFSYINNIFILNQNNNTWVSFTDAGLPSNYSVEVEKLVVAGRSLVSAEGENGTFYIYSPSSNHWTQNYYLSSSYNAGLSVQDMIYDNGAFLVSTGRQLLYNNNIGTGFLYDTVGLKNEAAIFVNIQKTRVLYTGSTKTYVLSNVHVPADGTWVQQRSRLASAGATWATNESFLPLPALSYSYSILELNGTLFVATDDGIYTQKTSSN